MCALVTGVQTCALPIFYIDVVSPQRLSYFLLNAVPISLIAVVLAVAGWAVADDKRDVRLAPRQFLILLLLIYCWLTTLGADFPKEALDKWDWVWKDRKSTRLNSSH